jgi:hypothetical protein
MVLLVCSQFGLSQSRDRAPTTKPSSAARSETKSTPNDEGPSLEDTVSWLNQNAINYAFVDTREVVEIIGSKTDKDNLTE